MSIIRIAAALAAPAVAAAFLSLGAGTAAAQPREATCIAAQNSAVSSATATNVLTRAGQVSGADSRTRTQAPTSCIGH